MPTHRLGTQYMRLAVWRRSAPTRQIDRVLAFRELKCHFERTIEIILNNFAFDVSAESISPQKFTERGRILGEAAGSPQFA